MTSHHLLSLADRVEGLSGPDREVDAEIHVALGGALTVSKKPNHPPTDRYSGRLILFYTSSIDDAVTLVPGGYDWCVFADGFAGVAPADPDDAPDAKQCGATPALALCAASLRAIAGGKE